jgi:NADPH:quinone reductase
MLRPVLAARVHAFGTDPVLEEVREPEPQPGEALVDIAAAPIGHIDLTVLRGTFAYRPPLPYVPGTDAAGTVIASAAHPAGTRVRLRGAGLGLTRDGTWRRLVAAPDEAVHVVPPNVDPTVASVCFSPVATAHTAVHEVGGIVAGERVAVTGAAGAVGSLAVQLALRAGADVVFGLVSSREKAHEVAEGARAVIAGDALPTNVDVLIDTVGGLRLPERLSSVRKGGRAVLVGYTAGTEVTLDLPAFLAGDVRVLPVSMLERRLSGELVEELLQLVSRGVLRLPFDVRPLSDVSQAIDDVRAGRVVGRVALDPAS